MTVKLPNFSLLWTRGGRVHKPLPCQVVVALHVWVRLGSGLGKHMAIMLVGSGLHTTLTSNCRNNMEMNDHLQLGGQLSPLSHEHVSLSSVGLADSIC
jgi:hypothetical protein